jgi:hypothetical protein
MASVLAGEHPDTGRRELPDFGIDQAALFDEFPGLD